MRGQVFWAVVAGFLLGVLARSFLPLGMVHVAFVALFASVVLAIPLFLSGDRSKLAFSIAIACIALSAGVLRMEGAVLQSDPLLDDVVGKKVILEGIVAEEPDVRELSIRIPLRAHTLVTASSSHEVVAGVLAIAAPHTEVEYGNTVRVEGTLRLPEAFDTGLGRVFNYPGYLAKDGILYQLSNAEVERLKEGNGNFVKAAAIEMKHLYLRGLAHALPEPESALAGGITVGDKRSIGEELTGVFQRVSLVHIIVLSGYNITIVINAVAKVLSGAPRFAQFGLSGAVIVFFVLMTGGAASAIRAGAMASLAMYARISGRMFFALRALALVAALMVLWDPYTLSFDPSFQLSVLATLGLILFTPIFASRMRFITERFALREIAASTLGTQLAVLPLLLYQSGTLSLVALPVNLLALVPIPFAMFFSLIASIAGVLFGSFAVIVGFPAYVLLSYIIAVAELFAVIPFAAISLPGFSIWWVVASYFLLFGVVGFFKRRLFQSDTGGGTVRGGGDVS